MPLAIATPLESGYVKVPVPDARFTSVIDDTNPLSPYMLLDADWRAPGIVLRRGGELSFRLVIESAANPSSPGTGGPTGTFYLTFSGDEPGDPYGAGVAYDRDAGIPQDFYILGTPSGFTSLDRLFSFKDLPGRLAFIGYRSAAVAYPGVFDTRARIVGIVS